jgi:outer membrane protein OmpA-like peptidoglycan-associated protein
MVKSLTRRLAVATGLAMTVAVGGCEHDDEGPAPGAEEVRPAEGLAERSAATGAGGAQPPERVASAVTIIGLQEGCPAVAVTFDRDQAALDAEDEQQLRTLAQCLRGTPGAEVVELAGSASPPGSEEYNELLANQRAVNVASFLRLNGVSESRFEIRVRGELGEIEGMPLLYPAARSVIADPQAPPGE